MSGNTVIVDGFMEHIRAQAKDSTQRIWCNHCHKQQGQIPDMRRHYTSATDQGHTDHGNFDVELQYLCFEEYIHSRHGTGPHATLAQERTRQILARVANGGPAVTAAPFGPLAPGMSVCTATIASTLRPRSKDARQDIQRLHLSMAYPGSQQAVLASQQTIAASQQGIAATQQAITAPQQAITAPQQAITAPQQAITAPQQTIVATQQAIAAPVISQAASTQAAPPPANLFRAKRAKITGTTPAAQLASLARAQGLSNLPTTSSRVTAARQAATNGPLQQALVLSTAASNVSTNTPWMDSAAGCKKKASEEILAGRGLFALAKAPGAEVEDEKCFTAMADLKFSAAELLLARAKMLSEKKEKEKEKEAEGEKEDGEMEEEEDTEEEAEAEAMEGVEQ